MRRGQKVRSTRDNAASHDGELVTRFLWCDELTGSQTFINAVVVAKEKEKQKNVGVSPRILRR